MIDWAGFVPAAIVVSLIPGANQLLGLRNAARYGVGHAMAGISGRFAAFVVLIALVAAGLGTLLAASAELLTILKWVGVAYLLWLGLSSILRARREMSQAQEPPKSKNLRAVVVNEFAVAISNPKALLLFAALLPQFTTTGSPAALAELGSAYLGVELVVGLAYVLVGRAIGVAGVKARTQRKVDVGSGICFVILAGVLALDSSL
ncbi:LysE family translocator [Amycolatopsis sp. NPDC023774]|uniref:LysE family translocator n=1 Tax=Amycolatopsis sp. NPDC023774 TaxID=3155015 RepID=UPI0033FF2B0F